MLYPPNNSSDPSPDKTTFTCLRASRATKYNGTQDGSANGSSICHIIFGSFSIYSSGEMMYEMFSTSNLSAVSLATSTSEKPSRSNPTENVFIFGLISLDRKSTRLNSSHVAISYAVFCLKKKNNVNILIHI